MQRVLEIRMKAQSAATRKILFHEAARIDHCNFLVLQQQGIEDLDSGQVLYNPTFFLGKKIEGRETAGVRGGRDFEDHAWSLGAQMGIRLQDRIEIRPSGDWYFGDRTPFRWQLNGDATITFGPGRSIYGGGGIAFVKVLPLDKVKTGYNGLFGLNFAPPSARSRPFAEFRWTWVNSTSPFRLVLGLNYRLGG